MLFLVGGIGYRMIVRGAGPEDLAGLVDLGTLVELASAEDESIPVRQINRHRLSQP